MDSRLTRSTDKIPGPGAYQAPSCFGQYIDLPYYLSIKADVREEELPDAPAGILTAEKFPHDRRRSKSRQKVIRELEPYTQP